MDVVQIAERSSEGRRHGQLEAAYGPGMLLNQVFDEVRLLLRDGHFDLGSTSTLQFAADDGALGL